jgi:predicted dehydrogenase
MRSLKVGLIGLGSMGRNHLRVLSMLKTVNLEFVYDIDRELTRSLAEKYEVRAAADVAAEMRGVDALVIASPTTTHLEYALMAVDNGVKNIFIEKPVTDSLENSERLGKLLEDKGVLLQVGYIERFNPAVIELKKILSNSEKVISVDLTRTNKLSSRITDIDVILDLMIHDIDLALYLNGGVKDVFAHGSVDNDMVVFASAVLTHDNGRFSRITASRITEKRIRSINATCADMFVDCDLLKKEIFINKQIIHQAYENVKLASVEETVSVSTQETLLNELIAFVDSSLNRKLGSEVPDIHAALLSMRIASEIQNQIWSRNHEA